MRQRVYLQPNMAATRRDAQLFVMECIEEQNGFRRFGFFSLVRSRTPLLRAVELTRAGIPHRARRFDMLRMRRDTHPRMPSTHRDILLLVLSMPHDKPAFLSAPWDLQGDFAGRLAKERLRPWVFVPKPLSPSEISLQAPGLPDE